MHGHIDLHSKLGSGTTATFNVPLNKASHQTDDTPLIDLASIPDRLQSDASLSYTSSDDRTTPPPTPSGWDESGLHKVAGSPAQAAGTPHKHESSDHLTDLSSAERQHIHVLVVEDKYVATLYEC